MLYRIRNNCEELQDHESLTKPKTLRNEGTSIHRCLCMYAKFLVFPVTQKIFPIKVAQHNGGHLLVTIVSILTLIFKLIWRLELSLGILTSDTEIERSLQNCISNFKKHFFRISYKNVWKGLEIATLASVYYFVVAIIVLLFPSPRCPIIIVIHSAGNQNILPYWHSHRQIRAYKIPYHKALPILFVNITHPIRVLDSPITAVMPIGVLVTKNCNLIKKYYVSKEFRIFTDSCAKFESATEII